MLSYVHVKRLLIVIVVIILFTASGPRLESHLVVLLIVLLHLKLLLRSIRC